MAEALSPADRSSLAAEQGPVHMTVGGLMVFEAGPGLRYDAVVERVPGLGPRRAARKSEPEEQGPVFDADAALARYLENRPADLPPIVPPVAPPIAESAPRRGFGRKGL